jgi:lipopolysaccharide export system protein LptC
VIAFLQMRSQFFISLVCTASALACGKQVSQAKSYIYAPEEPPDLSLRQVAFARSSEGRMVSRGTAARLDYRRSGGQLDADQGAAQFSPEPGTGLASFGVLRFSAPRVQGEIASKRGTASGGVTLDTARGDHARTAEAEYDNDVVRSHTPVVARGPGYDVRGNGLFARTDGSDIQLTGGTSGALQMEAKR